MCETWWKMEQEVEIFGKTLIDNGFVGVLSEFQE